MPAKNVCDSHTKIKRELYYCNIQGHEMAPCASIKFI